MKNMFRIIPVVALIGCLGLVGCGSSDSGSSDESSSSGATEQAQQEQAQEATSDYEVKIGKTKLGKDYEGDPCLIVTYTFTNNSDEKMSASSACNFEAYQDGSELEMTFDSDWDSDDYYANCKKGGSQKFQLAFELDNKKSDVELEVSDFISFDDTVIASKTVSIK